MAVRPYKYCPESMVLLTALLHK